MHSCRESPPRLVCRTITPKWSWHDHGHEGNEPMVWLDGLDIPTIHLALSQLERFEALDAWDGFKLRYINPLTGGSPMPTMQTFIQRLPAGFVGLPYRQTDGTVFSVVEGTCRAVITKQHGSRIDEFCYELSAQDHFVVPSWHTLRLSSSTGCVLFSYSDRPIQEALGIHREERLSA